MHDLDDLGPAAAGLCSWLEAALSADRATVMVHLERRHTALVSTLVAQLRGESVEKLHSDALTHEEAVARSMVEAGVKAPVSRAPLVHGSTDLAFQDPQSAGAESTMSMLGRALAPVEYSLNALLLKFQESSGGVLSRAAAPRAAGPHFTNSDYEMSVSQEPRAGGLPNQNVYFAAGAGAYVNESEDSARGRHRSREGADREVPHERNARSGTRRPGTESERLHRVAPDQGAPMQTWNGTQELNQRGAIELRQGANPSDVSMRLNPIRRTP